jgi:SAM-dependent methyltransferase
MQTATIEKHSGILRSPITGQTLSILSPDELARSNRRLEERTILHRDGSPAQTPLTFALGTPERGEIDRVEESIVWLLSDLALVYAGAAQTAAITGERKAVQSFYDEYGWVKTDGGLFNDTAMFVDPRAFARDYVTYCNHRIGRELSRGRYLLDVASGPIPHAEYLDFSRGYDIRICMDISIRALREARAKLGDAGLYILGDITKLPLASDAIDDVVSLHTIYHVPRAEQTAAVNELVRVTKPGGRVVIVYVWGKSVVMALYFGMRSRLGRIRRAIQGNRLPLKPWEPDPSIPSLYFSPQDYDWFARHIAARYPVRLKVWSAVSTVFLVRFCSEHGLGRLILAAVKWLENCFPRMAGRYGQYPMFVIEKPLS